MRDKHFSIEHMISAEPVDYQLAIHAMQERIVRIYNNELPSLLWFLEHPPLYTAGTSAKDSDLLSNCFPVYQAGRGGQYTYHGPGQLVIYCMVRLKEINVDVRQYVKILEHWILRVLETYGIKGALYPDRIGVWVKHPITQKESKIAAIGIRVTKGVAWHGLSFNVNPDLSHFLGIIPCGISNFGVTSLAEIGVANTLESVICAFRATLPNEFT
ncbi:MAG: lipoyl(octanoyl) transferase LipB [Candidatus Paracaedibacteraceae bacterium]|nr:lipoyl(octanoyl) transferase LipB [Candidatus Paracaedibacteraceae bacterium]